MNTKKLRYLLAACIVSGFCTVSLAKSKSVADANGLKVKVVSVKGIAKKMQANKKPCKWTRLKAGEELSRFTEIRTGLNSQVELNFSDQGKIVIGSGTKIGISEFIAMAGKSGLVKARIGLKYGSMRLKVYKSRGANDFSVATAVATLSVRGTDGRISFSGDRGLFLFGKEGTFEVAKSHKRRYVHGRQMINSAFVRSMDIKSSRRDVRLGDSGAGLTDAERKNLNLYGSGRGIFGFVGNPAASETTTSCSSSGSHYQ